MGGFNKGCKAAPPVFSGGLHRYGRISVSSRACDHLSLCSSHRLVPHLEALRLATCPQEGCPLQKDFHHHLLKPLETWGSSLSIHSAPNTFLPLVFSTSVAFTLFHHLWLSAEEALSAGLQSSPRYMRFMFLQVWADGERDGKLLAAVAAVPLGANNTATPGHFEGTAIAGHMITSWVIIVLSFEPGCYYF